jgi:phospholipase C
LKKPAAFLATFALFVPAGAGAATMTVRYPRTSTVVSELQQNIKYVFVLYQENRSFDSYFGTFPGAEGIYSHPSASTLGFTQMIENVDGTFSTISPFRIGPAQYAADTDDVGHGHPALISKIDVTSSGPQMDMFAMTEEAAHTTSGSLPTLEAKQYGELTMAHEDCDTIPLLWNYAKRFVLFDHMFQNYTGPSTPGNITILAAQAGDTQYGLHPSEGYTNNGGSAIEVPDLNDRDPAWGPYDPNDGATSSNTAPNLTFASIPLTLAGASVSGLASTDSNASTDFADIGDDVPAIAALRKAAVPWGWFQEGYAKEPGETGTTSLSRFITHHNAPQYFGYLANSSERGNLHNLGSFFSAVEGGTLPAGGGVYYVKGGYQNILGLTPAIPAANLQAKFAGDDDHPGYSDAQISEATVADEINRIAASKYWSQSAIVIAWDDSEGDYDHVAPLLRSIGPGSGNVPADYTSDGPRIPMIVISPFAKTDTIVRTYGDQGSVVKFIDTVFGLPALGNLPDEVKGSKAAAALGHKNFDADDTTAAGIDNLVDAFDPGRLAGTTAPIPASYVEVNYHDILTLPQTTGLGCKALGIVPVDYTRGIQNNIPADFNPRPASQPTTTVGKRARPAAPARYTDPED